MRHLGVLISTGATQLPIVAQNYPFLKPLDPRRMVARHFIDQYLLYASIGVLDHGMFGSCKITRMRRIESSTALLEGIIDITYEMGGCSGFITKNSS